VAEPKLKPPLTMAELAAKPISELKSVGAGKRAENFAKFGITNLVELLTHYPRRWIDRTREAPIADAAEGVDVLVIGELRSVNGPPPGHVAVHRGSPPPWPTTAGDCRSCSSISRTGPSS